MYDGDERVLLEGRSWPAALAELHRRISPDYSQSGLLPCVVWPNGAPADGDYFELAAWINRFGSVRFDRIAIVFLEIPERDTPTLTEERVRALAESHGLDYVGKFEDVFRLGAYGARAIEILQATLPVLCGRVRAEAERALKRSR